MEQKLPLAPYILMALAFIGLGDTLFLSYYQFNNLIPSCAIGGCEIVLTSVYSKFFGIPWGYIGLLFYSFMLFLSTFLSLDPRGKGIRWATLAYATIGVICSAIFIFIIQIGLIHAVCMYCAISALTSLALFGTSLWHFRSSR
jgi:uncharacterized membrane protein